MSPQPRDLFTVVACLLFLFVISLAFSPVCQPWPWENWCGVGGER